MLSDANYKGELYDIGNDKPETHAIQKADTMYYAFYAKNWNGEVELRGLEDQKYKVFDYVNNKFISDVSGKNAKLSISFDKYLLIKAVPIN